MADVRRALVVGGASEMVGETVAVHVTSNVQTSVGRMLFASRPQSPERSPAL